MSGTRLLTIGAIFLLGIIALSHAAEDTFGDDGFATGEKKFSALSVEHCNWVEEKSLHDYSQWGGFVLELGWTNPRPNARFLLSFVVERGNGKDAGHEIDWKKAVLWNAELLYFNAYTSKDWIDADKTLYHAAFQTDSWSVTSFGMNPTTKTKWISYGVLKCPLD